MTAGRRAACQKCGTLSGPEFSVCPRCSTPLSLAPSQSDDEATVAYGLPEGGPETQETKAIETGWASMVPETGKSGSKLVVGSVVGARYEILQVLGEGGWVRSSKGVTRSWTGSSR